MKEKVKQMWNSRLGFGVICLIIGGLVGYFLMPEKERIVIKTVIEIKEKIVTKTVTKWKTRTVEIEKQVSKTTHKVTHPDGTIVEDTVFESNTQQISRMEEQYKLSLEEFERTYKQQYEYLKETINKKKLNLFAGLGIDVFNKDKVSYLGGFTYQLAGPFTLGVTGTSNADLYGTIGLRF